MKNKKFGNFFKRNVNIEEFIRLNYNRITPGGSNAKIALFELQMNFSAFIGYSTFAKLMSEKGIRVVGYTPIHDVSFIARLKFLFLKNYSIDNGINWPFRILKSMGFKGFLLPPILIGKHVFQICKAYSEYIDMSKNEKLMFHVGTVRVGDLFYDWHLRKRGLATFSANSLHVIIDFFVFINTFFYWQNFFERNNVDTVVVSHGVYAQGLVGRIGIASGSNIFLIGADRIYRLTEKEHFPDSEFKLYVPGSLSQFGHVIDLDRANRAIELLKSGAQDIDAAHAYVSGFKGKILSEVIENRNGVNILIATHCFSDAPHAYGDQLFTDFYEWLKFLGNLSQSSDFNWYIKPHPGFIKSDLEHFENFVETFPNIRIVSADSSNLELFRQGINVVLTVHGTIAFEAAFENILVINASEVAPHIKYKFSLNPRSVEEFRTIIGKLPILIREFNVDKKEVLHFYDLHHLRKRNNIFFGHRYFDLLNFIGGYPNLFSSDLVFKFWTENIFDWDNEISLLNYYDEFYSSEQYFMEVPDSGKN